jgi:hypothetical protein
MAQELLVLLLSDDKYLQGTITMKKRTRGILEELSSFRPKTHSDEFIQSTGNNIIESAINLLTRIHETYDTETALDLERRFLNSIRAGNSKKFHTGVDKIKESKQK